MRWFETSGVRCAKHPRPERRPESTDQLTTELIGIASYDVCSKAYSITEVCKAERPRTDRIMDPSLTRHNEVTHFRSALQSYDKSFGSSRRETGLRSVPATAGSASGNTTARFAGHVVSQARSGTARSESLVAGIVGRLTRCTMPPGQSWISPKMPLGRLGFSANPCNTWPHMRP